MAGTPIAQIVTTIEEVRRMQEQLARLTGTVKTLTERLLVLETRLRDQDRA